MREGRVLVAQLGAREHYHVARMAAEHGLLARLITDVWCPVGAWFQILSRALHSSALTRFAGRRAAGIPSARVRALPRVGWGAWRRQREAGDRAGVHVAWLQTGREFAHACIPYLDAEHEVYFGYTGTSLEALRFERSHGIRTVLSQIDAARVHERILAEEQARSGDLVLPSAPVPEEYFRRIEEEWSEADWVVVNSPWTKAALKEQRLPEDKVRVLPLTYSPVRAAVPRPPCSGRLRVLWLGTLSVGKGLRYAVEAARQLQDSPVEFTFAGPSAIDLSRLKLPGNAKYLGPVPRLDCPRLYGSHDVFLFPTLSDGFGITQLEAMASGLPVVATPRCGQVVVQGVSGFIVRPGDAREIVEALLALMENPGKLYEMSQAAIARSREFAPQRLWSQYERLLAGRLAGSEENRSGAVANAEELNPPGRRMKVGETGVSA